MSLLRSTCAVKKRDVRLRDASMDSESLDDWTWKARRVLSRFGPRTVPALVEALVGGEDPAIRLFAVESLALLGPEARDASDALRQVAGHDADPHVRAAAATALGAVEATEAS